MENYEMYQAKKGVEKVVSDLPKPTFDHCPIILYSRLEYCPKPFHFELMWLEEKVFTNLIWSW